MICRGTNMNDEEQKELEKLEQLDRDGFLTENEDKQLKKLREKQSKETSKQVVKVHHNLDFFQNKQTRRHCPVHGAVLYDIKKDGKTLYCPICGNIELTVITKPMPSKFGEPYKCWKCGKEYYPIDGKDCPFCGESTIKKKSKD